MLELTAVAIVPATAVRLHPMPSDEVGRAALLFNEVWDILDLTERSPEDNEQMLSAALESRNLWRPSGTPKNHAISDWQVSRVYAELDDGANALAFAAMSLALCEAHQLGAFLTGYAHEAIARSHSVLGDSAMARRHLHQATIQAGRLADQGERQMLDDELADVERLLRMN